MYYGKCLCGVIKIEVSGAIDSIIHCHCSLCRKSTGTAYATNGFVDINSLKVVKGKEALSTFAFKPGRNRHFCSGCGSPIYSSNDQDKSRIRVRLGIFDSEIKEKPISHNFVTSKANWDNLDDNLPRYEAFEPNRQ
ncbi:MAG: GFA family protein [Colwellia sp.]|nr:GFA family protein [Colwellia sp.]